MTAQEHQAFNYLRGNVNSFYQPIDIPIITMKKVARIVGHRYETFNRLQKYYFRHACVSSYENDYFSIFLFNKITNNMTAKEAKILAQEVQTVAINNATNEINKAIESACNKGEFSVWIYKSINTEVKNKLESDGYKVEYFNQRNETSTKISW